MQDYRIGWYEEPLYPTDDAGYRKMRAETTLTLASGEREFTEAGYRRQMEFIQAIDVYGVDPARVEGITGFRRVDALCTQYGKKINAHAWSTAITTAASLHCSLASPNVLIFEYKPFPVVVQDEIVAEKLWHKDGWAYPIHGPGLGIEVQEDVVRRIGDAMKRWGVTRPNEDDIRKGGFSTPWDAPMIPPFPFRFRNAEILTLYWRTDPAAMAFLLPPPLRAEGDVACVHIYKMNDTDWLGPYAEANVMFGAALGDRQGAYSPCLVLSSDVGVAHGREIHGQPKKLGEPDAGDAGRSDRRAGSSATGST